MIKNIKKLRDYVTTTQQFFHSFFSQIFKISNIRNTFRKLFQRKENMALTLPVGTNHIDFMWYSRKAHSFFPYQFKSFLNDFFSALRTITFSIFFPQKTIIFIFTHFISFSEEIYYRFKNWNTDFYRKTGREALPRVNEGEGSLLSIERASFINRLNLGSAMIKRCAIQLFQFQCLRLKLRKVFDRNRKTHAVPAMRTDTLIPDHFQSRRNCEFFIRDKLMTFSTKTVSCFGIPKISECKFFRNCIGKIFESYVVKKFFCHRFSYKFPEAIKNGGKDGGSDNPINDFCEHKAFLLVNVICGNIHYTEGKPFFIWNKEEPFLSTG